MKKRSTIGRIAREGGDPIWYWLLRNGPHGGSFQWSSGKHGRKSDLAILHQIIAEFTESDADFANKAREAAIKALEHDEPSVLRRGIQVLSVVGRLDDLIAVRALLEHPDRAVAQDARSCLFERGQR